MSLPVIGGNKFTGDKGEKRSWIVCEGDAFGSGIKRIRDAMNEYGLRAPVTRTAETWFSITLGRKGPDEAVGSLSRKGIAEPARVTNRFIKRFTDHPRADHHADRWGNAGRTLDYKLVQHKAVFTWKPGGRCSFVD